MEYDDILQALCDVWERVKEIMKRFAERIRELFRELYYRDFYVRAEYTYIPIFRRNMPYHRRNF